MTLLSGTRLGPYEVLSPVGAGGMGEVYRARDSKLRREVAIKVLPEAFTCDPERLTRFEREARLLASLNHANIAGIYGLEESEGTRFLVLELVPGKTLADIIRGGTASQAVAAKEWPARAGEGQSGGAGEHYQALEIEEALEICRQIAEALEAAHEKGIIHRDLKPANIKVTPEGKVKVLDFGLAKAFAPDETSPSLSMSPTLTVPSMESGIILGTAAYMSPEQARGKPLDKRTDIWSFGCVLYECLTGRQAFCGETISDTVAAILKTEPEWGRLPQTTPAQIHNLLRRCLQKDRNLRLHDIADARIEVDEALARPVTLPGLSLPPQPQQRRGFAEHIWKIATLALLLTTLVLSVAMFYWNRAAAETYTIKSSILPPENSSVLLSNNSTGPVAVSPDGRRLAVVARAAHGRSMLWVRPLNSLSAQLLAGTEGALEPFWSHDSRSIGFFAGGELKKIDASGGPPQTLCDAEVGRGGSWNQDGIILFATYYQGPIYRVPAGGGVPVPVTKLDQSRKEISHRWPYFLPDGRHFLYFARNAAMGEQSGVYVSSLDAEKPRLLLRTESNAIYAPPGFLLTVRDRTLMACAFDAKQLKVTGDAFPIAEQVAVNMQTRRGAFSVSENGVLAYLGAAQVGSQLVWFDRSGKQAAQLGQQANYKWPQISPDGQRVAVGITDPRTGNEDIWVYDVRRGIRTRLTSEDSAENIPVWSPDGFRIAFASNRTGRFDFYQKASNGVGGDELILSSEGEKYPHSWSPDGRYIGYDRDDEGRVWIVPLFGDRKPFPFLRSELVGGRFQEYPAFSPDGRWLAYMSNESGRWEVFVAPFPTPSTKLQVSTAGGIVPRWRRDGRELFYLALDEKVMAAELTETNGSLKVSAVRPLFQASPVRGGDGPYDVSADGQRFLVNTVPEQAASAPILVQNWTSGLKH